MGGGRGRVLVDRVRAVYKLFTLTSAYQLNKKSDKHLKN